MQLQSVVIVSALTKKCPCCSTKLESRKVEVKWTQGASKSAYLLTDIQYCSRCTKGFFHSLLKMTKDSSGKTWTVCESKQPQKTATQAGYSKSTNKTTKQKNNKSKSNSKPTDVEFGIDEPIYDGASRRKPVITYGSPRSKQDSSFFTSAGTFKYGSRSRYEDWD